MILLQSDHDDRAWWDLPEERRQRIMDRVGGGRVKAFAIIHDSLTDQLVLVTVCPMEDDEGRPFVRNNEIVHVIRVSMMPEEDYTNDMLALRRNQINGGSKKWNVRSGSG